MPTFTLPAANIAITTALSSIASAHVDRADAFALRGLERQLLRYQAIARHEMPDGGNGHYFGQNWHGPALADLLWQVDRIAARTKIGKAA